MINNIPVINFHEHPRSKALEENNEWGVDFTVLLTVGRSDSLRGRMMAKDNPDRCVSFHWIEVFEDMDKEIHRLKMAVKNWNIRGVKFQPLDQHIYMNDERLTPVYEFCESEDLIVTWHTGMVSLGSNTYELNTPILIKYTDPVYLDEVAVRYPDLKIVIAHLGGNFIYTANLLAAKHRNIYLDTAFLTYFAPRLFPASTPEDMIRHCVINAGEDKILYGGEGVRPEHILNTDISDEAKEKILFRNAEKLLGPDIINFSK